VKLLHYFMSKAVERLDKFLENKSMTRAAFERAVGLSSGYIRTAMNRGSDLGDSKIGLIANKFPDLSLAWLITGKGPMLLNEEDRFQVTQEPSTSYVPAISGTDKGVPYYDIDFKGGFDMIFNENKARPLYYIDHPDIPDADCWVNVTGKSMSPFIAQGDKVALKMIGQWDKFLLFGEVYAIVTDEMRTIKIVSAGKDNDHLLLIPYNKSPEFTKQQIPKALIRYVFQVKGVVKKTF